MSNDITMRPAYLGSSIEREGAFGDHPGQPARISIDDGFHVIDENGQAVVPPTLTLDVIMLWENDTRIYYNNPYDSSKPAPPDCWSDNRVTPSAGVPRPQSELCANCRHSVWDQPTPRGNMVPACDNRYKVACLVSGAGGGLFLLSVAPASRKPYEQYLRFLKVNHAGPGDVITKLGYADKTLSFTFSGWVNETTAKFVGKILLTDEAPQLVGEFDKPRQTQLIAGPSLPSAPPPRSPVIEFTDKPTVTEQWAASFTPPPATVAVPIAEPKRRGRPPKGETITTGVGPSSQPDAPQGKPEGSSLTQRSSRGFGMEFSTVRAPNTLPGSLTEGPKGNGGFGMEAPTAPPVNMQEALDRAFGPK